MSATPLVIANNDARALLLERYGLMASPRRALNRPALLAIIEALGFVQIDSISTIERAHHMILSARADGYRQADLWRLAERDRQLFENWTHDASLLPMSLFPYWQPRFQRCRDDLLARWQQWREPGFTERFDAVLDHVRDNGPVKARELAPEQRERKAQGWWDWHHDKVALEFLWRTGRLAVTRREGFQKVYDLTERVVPQTLQTQDIDDDQLIDWACTSALERLAYGTPADIAWFWASISTADVEAWISRQRAGRLITVEVEASADGRPRKAVALAGQIERQVSAAVSMSAPARLRVLSPFDPLIRDRKRMAHVFGFDYRIEVFVPEAKRQYGYYVCPMLEGDRLVGRIDMRHRRDAGGLVVRRVWWERGVKCGRMRAQRLDAELDRIRRFIGAEKVIWENGALT